MADTSTEPSSPIQSTPSSLIQGLHQRLLIGIPKKGRLHERCMSLLKEAGIEFRRKARSDITLCSNLNIALVFLPASDIAAYIGEGRVDMGITGQDIVAEAGVQVTQLLELGFGKCRLCVQAPKKQFKSAADIAGLKVVTSFPNLTKKYFSGFASDGPLTKVRYVSGSVEAACALGLADAIVDLVESGETMEAAGLEAVDTIMTTEAVLISNPKSTHLELIKKIQKRITGVITADRYSMLDYNIARCDLQAALAISPGKKSATLSSLDDANYVAVRVLVKTKEVNDVMDQLEAVKAEDLLVTTVRNCRA